MVRPVRETMGAIGGTKTLQGLMAATFVVMLIAVPVYSWLVNRLPRRWLVRVVFHFFCVSLIGFSAALQFGRDFVQVHAANVFFVWVNLFALFATSVFWSVLADVFSSDQGKRLFGRIAAGGTLGAIVGSALTSQLAVRLPTSGLLLVPAVTLQLGLWCAWRLERQVSRTADGQSQRPGAVDADSEISTGGLWQGILHVLRSPYLAMICVFLFFVQAAGTQLYFQQAEIVGAQVVDDQEKTQWFAYIDLSTQLLTLLGQLFVAGFVLRRLGVASALMLLPLVYLVSFSWLAAHESLYVVSAAMVMTRATGYGVTVPSREVLFTVVSREDKYKSKSFIDTVVLRGGDAVSGQLYGSLRNLGGFASGTLNLFTLPLVILWAYAAFRLGRRQAVLARKQSSQSHDAPSP